MSVSVKELLVLDPLDKGNVVAGRGGLSNRVSSVTVAEVPDAADWLTGGELIVTTGYFIKDNEKEQEEWLLGLIKGNAAALAIKTDRFLGTLSDTMLKIAEEQDFPLIELPMEVHWPTILENVMNKINYSQSQIIKRTEKIHNELTKAVLERGGLSHIAHTLARLLGDIVVVENIAMETLAVSTPHSDTGHQEVEQYLETRLSKAAKENFMETEFYKNAKTRNLHHSNKCKFTHQGITQCTMPIFAGDTTFGFVSLQEYYKKINESDIVALEHGATTIALEMIKEKAIYETEKRLKRDFLDDLIAGKIDTGNLMDKYNFIGFDISRPALVIILDIYGISPFPFYKKEHIFEKEEDLKIYRIIEKTLVHHDPKAFIDHDDNRFVILYHFSVDQNQQEILQEVKEICGKMVENILQKYPSYNYRFGVGGIYYQISKLGDSYREAKKALEIGELFMGKDQILVYNELGIYRVLAMVDNRDEIMKYCEDTIGDLVAYDAKHQENFCQILEEYLLHNGNITQTAKSLYLHHNTLAYKLKKISSILNKDLNDPKVRFNLFFAITLRKIHLH